MPDLSKIQSIAREEVPEEFQRGISMANKAGETGLNTTFVSDFPLDGSPMFPHQANGGSLRLILTSMDIVIFILCSRVGLLRVRIVHNPINNCFERQARDRITIILFLQVWLIEVSGKGYAGDANQDGLRI